MDRIIKITRMRHIEEYLQKFIDQQEVNKQAVKRQLAELVYIQVINRLNNEYQGLPSAFFENKLKWTNLLMKTKNVQGIFEEFTLKISQILENEIKNNRSLIDQYISHPRPNIIKGYKKLTEAKSQSPFKPKNTGHYASPLNFGRKIGGMNQNRGGQEIYSGRRNMGSIDYKRSYEAHGQTRRSKGGSRRMSSGDVELSYFAMEMKKIQEKIKNIDGLVSNFENNTDEMAVDLMEFEKEVEKMDHQKAVDQPGEAMQEMLEKWDGEEVQNEEEIQKYAGELWVSLEEYEKQLKEEIKGHQLHYNKLETLLNCRIRSYKLKTCFRIDALELALSEYKQNAMKTQEQYQMMLSDAESRLLRLQVDQANIKKLVYGQTSAKNFTEALVEINELKKALTSVHLDNNTYQQQFIRDIELYNSKNGYTPEQEEKFKQIEAIKHDPFKQGDIPQLFEDIHFVENMREHARNYNRMKDATKKVFNQLNRFGIVHNKRYIIDERKTKNAKSSNMTQLLLSETDKNVLYDMFEGIQDLIGNLIELSVNNKLELQRIQNIVAVEKLIVQNKEKLNQQNSLINNSRNQRQKSLIPNSAQSKTLQPQKQSLNINQSKVTRNQNVRQSKNIKTAKTNETVNDTEEDEDEDDEDQDKPVVKQIKEEFEKLIEKKYQNLIPDSSLKQSRGTDTSSAERSSKLKPEQILEIKQEISISLGGTQQTQVKLDNFKEKGVEQLVEDYNLLIKEEFMSSQNKGEKQQKFNIPLGDCIKIEYTKDGEMIGFSLRPKIANLMFNKKDAVSLKNLSQLLKINTYLNRLMTQGPGLEVKHEPKSGALVFSDTSNEISQSSLARSTKNKSIQNKINIQDGQLINEQDQGKDKDNYDDQLKIQLSEILSRNNHNQKQKILEQLQHMEYEQILNHKLQGIKIKGKMDNCQFWEYIIKIVDSYNQIIKDFPPAQRKNIDVQVLSLEIKDLMKEQQTSKKRLSKQNGIMTKESLDSHSNPLLNESNSYKYGSLNNYEKYLQNILQDEVTRTIHVLGDYVDQAKNGIKTLKLNNEIELFSELYKTKIKQKPVVHLKQLQLLSEKFKPINRNNFAVDQNTPTRNLPRIVNKTFTQSSQFSIDSVSQFQSVDAQIRPKLPANFLSKRISIKNDDKNQNIRLRNTGNIENNKVHNPFGRTWRSGFNNQSLLDQSNQDLNMPSQDDSQNAQSTQKSSVVQDHKIPENLITQALKNKDLKFQNNDIEKLWNKTTTYISKMTPQFKRNRSKSTIAIQQEDKTTKTNFSNMQYESTSFVDQDVRIETQTQFEDSKSMFSLQQRY
ncbi:UNKNOWN [Stylonychia lemnae]|uniref:Uncharacterized protein n=1 Tax=Stylonychia lemnae TaxID=5949 RepID=A0A078AG05_STYLE|nr:UNKNOWN [Stylonychia lemnae]|eukprot:CDW79813.1 UNKNOWN [Stylonychia lemnae]